jgi:hypothetical protein
MKSIYQAAKEIAKTGNFDKAWEVARKELSMDKSTTKEQWITFVKTKI